METKTVTLKPYLEWKEALNRRLGRCTAFDCVDGRDYTRVGGICPSCNGTGYVKEKAP